MYDAKEKVAYLSKTSINNPNLRFKKMYQIIQRKEFLEFAWEQIKGNQGARTAGIDGMTRKDVENRIDLENFLMQLSLDLKDGNYVPQPVRRVEIPKRGGKGKRPLGIPALRDRVVQSAIKLILEAVYEPHFQDTSHGFRPKRSCQTAVNDIIWRKFDWVIEGDIKGCFDNIKHGKLLDLLRKRFADEKFISLINQFLKSGYQMGYGTDGKLPIFETKQGTPQGGIMSPVLANIYMHEFDILMKESISTKKHEKRKPSTEYTYYQNKVRRLDKALKEGKLPYRMQIKEDPTDGSSRGSHIYLQTREEIVEMLRKFKKLRSSVPMESNESYYEQKTLGYVRYADDFVVLLGQYAKKEAMELKDTITQWFDTELKLVLSQEKTKITHSTKGFQFLGYDIVQQPSEKGVGYGKFAKVYTPRDRINSMLERVDNILKMHTNFPTTDLIIALNRVIAGWSNYHKIANSWSSVSTSVDDKIFWKVLHWLAKKHKSTIPKMIKKYVRKMNAYGRFVNRIAIPKGDGNYTVLKQCFDIKYTTPAEVANKIKSSGQLEKWHLGDKGDSEHAVLSRVNKTGNSIEDTIHLKNEEGNECNECGETGVELIVHHERRVKRGTRKDAKAVHTAAKTLKRRLLCKVCHDKQHENKRHSG